MESKFNYGIKIPLWNQNFIMESKLHYGINIPKWNYQMNDLNRDYSTANAALFAIFFVFQKIAISCKGDCKICDLVNNGCNFFFSKKLQIGHLQMKVLTTY